MEETFAYTPMIYYVYERGEPIKFVGKTWGLRKSYFNTVGYSGIRPPSKLRTVFTKKM